MPYFIILIILHISTLTNCQITDSSYADCISALDIGSVDSFTLDRSPIGFGDVQEFNSGNRLSIHFPEKESNSIWYRFEASRKGMMTFKIIPHSIKDDYDFSLYRIDSDSLCKQIVTSDLIPLRSNFSRNNIDSQSITGLSLWSKDAYVGQGPKAVYSSYIETERGQSYMLMVNNIYPKGDGHQLKFHYHVPIEISGKVTNDQGDALADAEVHIINTKSGAELGQTKTDSLGKYTIKIVSSHQDIQTPIQVEFSKEKHFFKDTIVTPIQLLRKKTKGIHAQLKTLHIGDVFAIHSILFYGDSPKPLKRSVPSIRSLVKTMKRNKTLQIEIIGHTNGCSKGNEFSMELSNNRVKTIFSFLDKGRVHQTRFDGYGIGCEKMIYPIDSRLNYLNRRVEIKIVSI